MREFPPFRLDLVNECLWRHEDGRKDQRILLSPKAFAMLRYLVDHAGRLVTQEELLESLWTDTYVQPEVLKSHIRDIRAILGDDPKNPDFIETVPRRGYRFIASVSEDSDGATSEIDFAPSILVGRHMELGKLRVCLQKALHGDRQVVFITGDPGIGKTSLTDTFLQEVRAGNLTVRAARGQCVEGYGGHEPYYPVLEAVGQLCHGAWQDSLVKILAAQAPTWLVQFPSLVKRDQREKLHREILGAGRERMLREMTDALETVTAESPTVLVFEDLHWADNSTIDLISVLARRRLPAKLLLLCTYRPIDVALAPHPLKGLKHDLLVHRLCQEIALEPLAEAHVAAYLAAQSGEVNLPPGLTELIYRQSEGNPLFMVTVIDHLQDRGLIAIENGSWRICVSLESIDLDAPESLRQTIELQIERLSVVEQRVLEVMSVLSKFPLSVTVGCEVTSIEPDALEELLGRLAQRHQIIRRADLRNHRTDPSPCYEFVHALYRQVIYSRLGPTRKRTLHRAVAEAVDALHVMYEEQVAAELAYQFEQGGEWPRAVKYLLLEADTAGRRFEPRQAAGIIEHALDLVNNMPEAKRAATEIEARQKLATIYTTLYDTRAAETYETLAVRASRYGMPEVESRALLHAAVPLAIVSEELYLRTLERAREALSRLGDTLERAALRVFYLCNRMGAGKGDAEDLEECRKLIARLRHADDRRLLGEAQLWFSYALRNVARYREAMQSADESSAILLRGHDENPYLMSHFELHQHLLCSCLLLLGEWGEMLQMAERRAQMASKNCGSAQVAGFERPHLQILAMDFNGAQQTVDLAPLTMSAIPFFRRQLMLLSGAAQVGLGNHERAIELLGTCGAEMARNPMSTDWYDRMSLQRTLTEAWLSKGELVQARAEAEQFLKVTLSTEEHTFRALAFEANARLAIAEDEEAKAQDCVEQALHEMERYEVPLAHWRVHATAASLQRRWGTQDLAEHHRALSCATIMELADSLPAEDPLRKTFLSAPLIRRILGDSVDYSFAEEP
jgi:DNA-binding winged helix-turn-helix (wHTH) protein